MKNLANLIKLSECPRLTEKYKGIAALPLDLPRFELDSADNFWRIWNEEKARVDRQHIDRGAVGKSPDKVSKEYTQWDGIAMYEDKEVLGSAAWVTKDSPAMAESQPAYLKSIFDNLPFVRIRSVRLWSSNCVIPGHYDGNMPASLDGKLRFPTEIRIMLDDQNPKETFWLAPVSQYKPHTTVPDEAKMHVRLPPDTNTFVWNNEDCIHGADYDPAYKKILVVIKGWVDIDRLETLLDKSIAKYPDYVVKF
jgi:hypothetical protein